MSEELIEELAIWADAKAAYHHALTSRGALQNKAAATVIAEALIAERQRGYAAGVDAAAALIQRNHPHLSLQEYADAIRALKENPDANV